MNTEIEALRPPAGWGRPWQVVLTGGETLALTEGVVADFALYAGMELTPVELERLRQAASLAAFREKALSLLAARPMSQGMLEEKLLAKGATEEQVGEILPWLQGLGLVNDQEYAKLVVRSYGGKGYGPYRIRQELYRRQVPKDCWEAAMEELEEDQGAEAIDRFLEKKLPDPTDQRQVKRASDALLRRGFSYEDIRSGLRRRMELWEE